MKQGMKIKTTTLFSLCCLLNFQLIHSGKSTVTLPVEKKIKKRLNKTGIKFNNSINHYLKTISEEEWCVYELPNLANFILGHREKEEFRILSGEEYEKQVAESKRRKNLVIEALAKDETDALSQLNEDKLYEPSWKK